MAKRVLRQAGRLAKLNSCKTIPNLHKALLAGRNLMSN